MASQPTTPIIVQLPDPPTPETTVADVLLQAIGLTGAFILIAFVVVASVFAFTVLSTGIFASERSKETVFSGIKEAQSSIEPRGSVIVTCPPQTSPVEGSDTGRS